MQIFVVQEQLREESQVFAVDRIFIAVDFKHGHTVLLVSVDLIPWGMKQRTGLAVPFELDLQREETQAEIADIEAVEVVIVDGVGTEVPGVSGIPAELQAKDGLKLGNFLMSEQFSVVHAEMRVIVGMDMRVIFIQRGFLDPRPSLLDARKGNPVIVALVEVLEVHVVRVGILIFGFGRIIIYNKINKGRNKKPTRKFLSNPSLTLA